MLLPLSLLLILSGSAKAASSLGVGATWCVAAQGAQPRLLQAALDYACGNGRADCRPIQPNGRCFSPNTLYHHASFAFNSYYQRNPIPTSCSFRGSAFITSSDPSTALCRFPSFSTASSILNTTNSIGASVFGAVPSSPSSSSAYVARLPACSAVWFFFTLTLW